MDGHFIREIIRRVNWRQEGKHVGKRERWSFPFPCRIMATWQKTAMSECKELHYTQAILSHTAGAVGQNKYPGPSLCSQKSCKNGDCGMWTNRSIGPSLGIKRQNQYNWKTNVSISTAEDIQKLYWYHRIFIRETWKIVMLLDYLPAVISSWEPTWKNTFIAINRIAYCMSIYQGLFPSGTYSQSKNITITAHQIGCDSCFTTKLLINFSSGEQAVKDHSNWSQILIHHPVLEVICLLLENWICHARHHPPSRILALENEPSDFVPQSIQHSVLDSIISFWIEFFFLLFWICWVHRLLPFLGGSLSIFIYPSEHIHHCHGLEACQIQMLYLLHDD